jgi:hypothetical protein
VFPLAIHNNENGNCQLITQYHGQITFVTHIYQACNQPHERNRYHQKKTPPNHASTPHHHLQAKYIPILLSNGKHPYPKRAQRTQMREHYPQPKLGLLARKYVLLSKHFLFFKQENNL